MKFDLEHVVAGLALLAIGYHLGKRRPAGAAAAGAIQPQATASPAAWWTYAGSWV